MPTLTISFMASETLIFRKIHLSLGIISRKPLVGFGVVGKKMLTKEIEAEERELFNQK